MQVSAPAKVNLSFRILGRRADGFHDIETLMVPISLGDSLVIERDEALADLRFTCDDPSVPAGEDNLVMRAARRFFDRANQSPHVSIHLTKRIPHGAGLGGGSSDAASTLLALNDMYGGVVAASELLEIAAALGSDVPFFLSKSAAICRGRGEIVAPTHAVRSLPLLLVKPRFGVATPWAYQHWHDSRQLPSVPYEPQELDDVQLINDLERPVFEKFVFLASLKTWMLAQREVTGALMSGSGSTVFAVLRSGEDGDGLAARLRDEVDPEIWTCACETLG
jgi:4-diphosphocytidyl-2-C-methyl-D-erythritol kinase